MKVTAYGLCCLIHECRLARWLNFAVHQRILLWTDICMLELSPTLRYFLTFVLDLQLGRRNWLNITQIHSLWRLISRLHADREFVSIDIYLCIYIHIYVVKVSFSAWHLPTLSACGLCLFIYFQLQRPHERIKYKRVINTCSTRVLHTDAWQVYRRKWTRSWMVWFCRVSKERTKVKNAPVEASSLLLFCECIFDRGMPSSRALFFSPADADALNDRPAWVLPQFCIWFSATMAF